MKIADKFDQFYTKFSSIFAYKKYKTRLRNLEKQGAEKRDFDHNIKLIAVSAFFLKKRFSATLFNVFIKYTVVIVLGIIVLTYTTIGYDLFGLEKSAEYKSFIATVTLIAVLTVLCSDVIKVDRINGMLKDQKLRLTDSGRGSILVCQTCDGTEVYGIIIVPGFALSEGCERPL